VVPVGSAVDGTVALAGNGDVTFTPATGFVGDATFVYTVTDGIGTDTATVTITVTSTNNPPVAVDDAVSQTGAANAIPHATLLANDSDGGDGGPLVIIAVGTAVNGSVTLQGNTVTFTPNADFVGAASFEYTVGLSMRPCSRRTHVPSFRSMAGMMSMARWEEP